MRIFIITIIFPIIINLLVLHLPAVAAKYLLSQGDELNSTSTLASSSGMFTMGFFDIPTTGFIYLGIWYTNDPRKVWVANRDAPMISYGVLIIDASGTLKVINKGTNTTMFNVSNEVEVGSGINTIAVLEDSGNFVLYDNLTKNRILWQSFDHPTNTLLPGMRLGYNLTTGRNLILKSWLSDKNPASGTFTLRLDHFQNSTQLVIYKRGKIYWSSDPWELHENFGYQSFSNGTLISDASGKYFSFPVINNGGISLLKLSSMGQIIGRGQTLVRNYCYQGDKVSNALMVDVDGAYRGCASFTLPICRREDGPLEFMSGIIVGGLIQNDDSLNISLIDCTERCWNDCNCKAFSTISINGTGCTTWGAWGVDGPISRRELMVGRWYSYTYVPPKSKTWIWILVSGLCVLIFVLTTPFCYARIRRRILQAKEKRKRNKYIQQLIGASDSFNYGDVLEKDIKDAPDIKIFSLGAILAATNNFSKENKLGQGGYGPVYKGKLFDGREIAVKRLSKTSGQGIEEFKNELILISKLQHTNLVRLYGCCIHQEEKMLIYEFMPNKSFDFFLFDEDKKKTIDWWMRFNIIQGVAQGLLYLHKYSRMKVIHRDLKVSNVLLDGNMNPKIADFGLARIFQQNVTEAITNRVVGTYGYMAPEYAMEGTFSIKSDVFSFGVLILEIVSGKQNSRLHNIDRPLNLVGYAWELWKEDLTLELKDEALDESFDLKQLQRTIHVGLLCVQDNADDRPTMLEAISMLNNEIGDLPNPKQPAFFTGRHPLEVCLSGTKSTNYLLDKNMPVSRNGLSTTIMKAR